MFGRLGIFCTFLTLVFSMLEFIVPTPLEVKGNLYTDVYEPLSVFITSRNFCESLNKGCMAWELRTVTFRGHLFWLLTNSNVHPFTVPSHFAHSPMVFLFLLLFFPLKRVRTVTWTLFPWHQKFFVYVKIYIGPVESMIKIKFLVAIPTVVYKCYYFHYVVSPLGLLKGKPSASSYVVLCGQETVPT